MGMEGEFRENLVALVPRLRRFALALTGSADTADDLVQDALERALERVHQWQPGTRLDSWMFRIMQTIRLNQVRAQAPSAYDPAGSHGEPSMDGVRYLDAVITLEEVRRAIAELPEEKRMVLILVCLEGLTYKETAEVLEIPIGTVMSRMSNARLALHGKFTDRAEEAGETVIPLDSKGDEEHIRRYPRRIR